MLPEDKKYYEIQTDDPNIKVRFFTGPSTQPGGLSPVEQAPTILPIGRPNTRRTFRRAAVAFILLAVFLLAGAAGYGLFHKMQARPISAAIQEASSPSPGSSNPGSQSGQSVSSQPPAVSTKKPTTSSDQSGSSSGSNSTSASGKKSGGGGSPTQRNNIVAACGSQLCLNGKPYHFTGFNLYQANSNSNCSYTLASTAAGKTNTLLDQTLTAINGGDNKAPHYVFRAWFFQKLELIGGKWDPNFTIFDNTLRSAQQHGLKVIITLTNQWGSCENSLTYPSYKYLSWYTNSQTVNGVMQPGAYAQDIDGMPYSYLDYVKQVVGHYAHSSLGSAILSYQLVNEPEAKGTSGCNESAASAALLAFSNNVGSAIKHIDPYHMVNIGSMGGGQCGWKGGDYQTVNASPYEDWCEFHDYGGDTAASVPTNLKNDLTACKTNLKKPLFIGEIGLYNSGTHTYCGNTANMSNSQRATDFDACFSAQFGAGVAGILPWSFHDQSGSNCGLQSPPTYEIGPCDNDPAIGVIQKYEP